jgi:hypothetical protein
MAGEIESDDAMGFGDGAGEDVPPYFAAERVAVE